MKMILLTLNLLLKRRKDNLVTLTINRKRLANATAVIAKRHRIGVTAQRNMLANVIIIGGESVVDFSLSNKTVRKAGADTVREVAEKIKKDLQTLLDEDVDLKECFIIYYDGKALQKFHDQGPKLQTLPLPQDPEFCLSETKT